MNQLDMWRILYLMMREIGVGEECAVLTTMADHADDEELKRLASEAFTALHGCILDSHSSAHVMNDLQLLDATQGHLGRRYETVEALRAYLGLPKWRSDTEELT